MIPTIKLRFESDNEQQINASKFWNDDITEQILYGGSKGGGKSYLGCALIFLDALMYPETHYFIARKELIDLRKFTMPSIIEVFVNFGMRLDDYATFNGQDSCFNLTNGSKVFLIACKEEPADPLFERFGSMQMTRGWIEEAGEIAEQAKSNLWLSVGRWKNEQYKLKKKLLITSNPKKGWLKQEFIDPYKKNQLHETKQFIPAFARDNSYLPDDYIKTLSEIKDQTTRERLYLGNWDYEDDKKLLVSFDALSDAFSNTITKDNKKYLIVDVARFGDDSTTFSFWDGLELYKIHKKQKQSVPMTIQSIKDYASAERIPFSNIMVDEDGIGGGVVDGLQGVRGFIANSSAIPTSSEIRAKQEKVDNYLVPKTNYANLKAQCGWKLAEMINEHNIAFKVPDMREIIIAELTALLKKDKSEDEESALRLRPKDEAKKELGRSPDIGDPIIYRMWFELNASASSVLKEVAPEVVRAQQARFRRNRETDRSNK